MDTLQTFKRKRNQPGKLQSMHLLNKTLTNLTSVKKAERRVFCEYPQQHQHEKDKRSDAVKIKSIIIISLSCDKEMKGVHEMEDPSVLM